MIMDNFEGKTAIVTGGTTGIGLAVARNLAEQGAYVFVTGRRKPELDDAVRAIGPLATGVQGDAANPDDLDRLYDAVRGAGRGIDVLVPNAGAAEAATLEQTTEEHFDWTFGLNVRGVLFTVRKALPLLHDGASIVLISSTVADTGRPGYGAYAAAKAAIRSFARTWAAELKERGVRVNVITPGPIETPGLTGLAPDPSQAAQFKDYLASTIPLGRLGRVDEVANAILFMASDRSSFVTGASLDVDGGLNQT